MRYNPEQEIEQICAGCPLKETKPGTEPPHLARAIWIANELEEDFLTCGGLDYPAILDHLDPFEWVCLVAIKAARRNSEHKATQKPQQQTEKAQQRDHLQRLAHGS